MISAANQVMSRGVSWRTSSRSNEKRHKALALVATALIHALLLLALLSGLLDPVAGPGKSSERGLSVFDVGLNDGASALEPAAALPAIAPSHPPAASEAPSQEKYIEPVATPAAAGGGASGATDPFASAGLAPMHAVEAPAVRSGGGFEGAADANAGEPIIAQIVRAFRQTHPAASGTATFALTIMPDGSVTDVRYVAGTLGPGLGAVLAGMLESQKIYAEKSAAPIRTMFGPVTVAL